MRRETALTPLVGVLVVAAFTFAAAGLHVLHRLTAPELAPGLLTTILRSAVEEDRAAPGDDLLAGLTPTPDVASVRARAEHLYAQGFPQDPGPTRTEVPVARPALSLLTEERHAQLERARMAAVVGAAAGILLLFFTATGRARFLLPGASLLLGLLLLRWHVGFAAFWLTSVADLSVLVPATVRQLAVDPARYLFFGGVALTAAGWVFGLLLPSPAPIAGLPDEPSAPPEPPDAREDRDAPPPAPQGSSRRRTRATASASQAADGPVRE